jgi:predicted membrane protein
MKALTYILSIIAAGLVVFNLTQINYSNPLHDDSIVALITVITGLCAILLLTILRVSKKIEKLQKTKA